MAAEDWLDVCSWDEMDYWGDEYGDAWAPDFNYHTGGFSNPEDSKIYSDAMNDAVEDAFAALAKEMRKAGIHVETENPS
jgi:hypothetical protein